MPFRHLLPPKHAQAAKAAVLVGLGMAGSARRSLEGSLRILTFHGLQDEDSSTADTAPLDDSLHLPVKSFESICQLLASKYAVISLTEAVHCIESSQPLPADAVAITFDDGYESNFHLALPLLQAYQLPATIFLSTAFLDGTDVLWFQEADWALATTLQTEATLMIGETPMTFSLTSRQQRQSALTTVLDALKKLPTESLRQSITAMGEVLEVAPPTREELPPQMRPMTWDQAREMQVSGLIEFGGHTHRHPIMAQCESDTIRWEIETCRDRMRAELGRRPYLFAYPNGGTEDFDTDCEELLREAGFKASFSMVPTPAELGDPMMSLPRFGSPETVIEAEATVSGAFTLAKRLKNYLRPNS